MHHARFGPDVERTDDHDGVNHLEARASRSADAQGRHFFVWWVLPDVVQCTPQETASGRTGKGQIEARLITHADNPRGIAGQLASGGCSQLSCRESMRAVLIRALTCAEVSPTRHSTDHG